MSQLLLVEIFWDGDGFYFANLGESERLGGPHEKIHAAWKEADDMGLEVVRVSTTRGKRSYRNPNANADSKQALPEVSKP